ncbi:cache domain-containing protein [Vibrio sp. D404a]|uniref:sensor histidine kinase n=1 Tax=unclassified Vibrio TaxID=2614977 RepID=UPI002553B0F6|nr:MULTISPECIES: HAMP domain-containing sensor histidine kinase [unclassified Vibrio]MDK9735849.1 cache domain-containing protein [Vibrio sp. D404a]MDK9796713.1 cache domain-containing protein [Vibrio sp. D449a]
MPTNRHWWAKWSFRFKTMVRYRLLFLTSAPIILTLCALIAITLYWSVHYTWQGALIDVDERLDVADNSIHLIQNQQAYNVRAFSESYRFRNKLQSDIDEEQLVQWVSENKSRYELDFLRWHSAHTLDDTRQFLDLTRKQSFFSVLTRNQLNDLDHNLAKRAEVPLLNGSEIETRGLVSRTVIAIYDGENRVVGFLDGGILLNNSTQLVDQISNLIYPRREGFSRRIGTVTVFLDDLRVSTNVPLNSDESEGRAIGTRVSHEVHSKVLNKGQEWLDRAYVYDAWYITAYQPIRDQHEQVIGMLYTGYLIWPLIETYLTNLGEISVTIVALLLLSGFIVHRGARDLFNPIERIHKVVKLVQMGQDKRIGTLGLDDQHELTQLAKQFDKMLDLLHERNQEIQKAALELECKVHSRTASLKEKTEQLEHHITLLNQARDKLVVNEKLAALGELTAGIAHEINNPTAVILGNVELMKFELGEETDRVNEEIQAIMEQIDRIRNITRSLLQYSRHGGVQDEVTWQHINPIVDESITLVKTGAKKRGIVYHSSLNAKTSVEVNRNQLLQILVNLQMNAIHAMDGEGNLNISSEDWIEDDVVQGAVIHVEDEGCGIKEEQLKRIFSPFYTTKRDGTGLGLSVSQSILSQTGGEIRVASELGKGSRFSVYLPKKAVPQLLVSNVT